MSTELKPFESSQCHGCAHKRDVRGKRSWFLLCAVHPNKYPPQPVQRCPFFLLESIPKPSDAKSGL